jgi:hypothetical protein
MLLGLVPRSSNTPSHVSISEASCAPLIQITASKSPISLFYWYRNTQYQFYYRSTCSCNVRYSLCNGAAVCFLYLYIDYKISFLLCQFVIYPDFISVIDFMIRCANLLLFFLHCTSLWAEYMVLKWDSKGLVALHFIDELDTWIMYYFRVA